MRQQCYRSRGDPSQAAPHLPSPPRLSLGPGVTPAVHSEGLAPLAIFLRDRYPNEYRETLAAAGVPHEVPALCHVSRVTISSCWPPDSECRPAARLLRVGCGFSKRTWNESSPRAAEHEGAMSRRGITKVGMHSVHFTATCHQRSAPTCRTTREPQVERAMLK